VGVRFPSGLLSFPMKAFFVPYYVYILRSLKNGSFYKGSTDNIDRRLAEHNSLKEKSTSRFAPWELCLVIEKPNRSEAVILEKKLKNLNAEKTFAFINRYSEKM
ncbi:MAG TPA: GIY-YIG nuclease family protein, partial [Flavobacteriales bacterium]|nr:GIY-YIG nuclease family protein [Flavobacteriales bacterium]